MSLPRDLPEWLAYIERQHPQAMALGLERVTAVRARMHIAPTGVTVSVGGTNGKGSVCAMLEAILRSAGYRVGLYTSPHLTQFAERVRIDGASASDADLCAAFSRVEAARGGIELTYFEYATLAALSLFAERDVDVAVLEVGLGGRLDAVNVCDADCAVISSIGIDHVRELGATREDIGREKAGLFRAGRPAVIADRAPPQSVLAVARQLGAPLYRIGEEFDAQPQLGQWLFRGPRGNSLSLAYPAMRGSSQVRNAAAALCALELLRARLPVTARDIRTGLARAVLRGRFEVLPGKPQIVLDVAHNAQAAQVLAENLGASGYAARSFAVWGMLSDKAHAQVAQALARRITHWHVADLPGPRGAQAADLCEALAALDPPGAVTAHSTIVEAYRAAKAAACPDDRIIVFGSFLTVGAVLPLVDPVAV